MNPFDAMYTDSYNLDDNDVRSKVYIYNLFISNNVFF